MAITIAAEHRVQNHVVLHTATTLRLKAAHTTNAIAFAGHVHGHALAPGRYRVTIVARAKHFRDATPRTLSFTIVRKRG